MGREMWARLSPLVPAHKTPGTCEKSGQRHAEAMEGDGQGKGKLRNF